MKEKLSILHKKMKEDRSTKKAGDRFSSASERIPKQLSCRRIVSVSRQPCLQNDSSRLLVKEKEPFLVHIEAHFIILASSSWALKGGS